MNQTAEILSELQRRGVVIAVEGGTLCLKPKRALDDALLARVREHKPELIRVLSACPATCAPGCYEVEPGVWIHRPWDGCSTVEIEAGKPERRVRTTCWHCQGAKTCDCIACWNGGPGECVACKGSGTVLRWIQ